MGDVELVPHADLISSKGNVFYLPTHDMLKDSSSTTKLPIVFYGSTPTA